MQLESLSDASQDQTGFQHCEWIADALAWSDAEGDVGISLAVYSAFSQKSFRFKLVGLLPEGGIAVQGIDANGDHRSGRNCVTTDDIIIDCSSADDPGRREEPQALVQDEP